MIQVISNDGAVYGMFIFAKYQPLTGSLKFCHIDLGAASRRSINYCIQRMPQIQYPLRNVNPTGYQLHDADGYRSWIVSRPLGQASTRDDMLTNVVGIWLIFQLQVAFYVQASRLLPGAELSRAKKLQSGSQSDVSGSNGFGTMTKRQAEADQELDAPREAKRQFVGHEERFRDGLFNDSILELYKKNYSSSKPSAIH